MNYMINKVAVLGAGVMGAGIAAHIVGAGIPVCLLDIVPPSLSDKDKAKGLTEDSPAFRKSFAQAGKDKVTNPKNRLIYDKILGDMIQVGNFTDDFDMLKDCDWIIEVIVENLDVKKGLMKRIAEVRKPGSIVSSNTSGVSINKIVEDMPLEFRQHFLGTHFFNPPRYMNLFEIIPGQDTDQAMMTFMSEFGMKRLGKGVVMAKDTPNFIGNRIGTFASVDAMHLMKKYNYSIPKVDQLTGAAIGRPKSATFRTIDMVGLDILDHVVGNVVNNVDDEAEKAQFTLPEFYGTLVEKKFLGDKTKQGFYKKIKTEAGREVKVWDADAGDYVSFENETIAALEETKKSKNRLSDLVYGDKEENKFIWEAIKNVLLYSASKVPEIADDYKEIDNAMMWGFNWEIGPFKIWDTIGFEKSIERMKSEGETIPAWIEERLNKKELAFYDPSGIKAPYVVLKSSENAVIWESKETALRDIGDNVACLEFNSRGNSLTGDVIEAIHSVVMEVEKNYAGLIIGNQSKNFSAGADLSLIGKLAVEKNWDAIDQLVERLQGASMALKQCKKPVVAAPYGMTLGGGAEIVMHAHNATAHAELYMGLVEAGVGLVPAGGGAKELLLRGMANLGKASNGEMLNQVKKIWETIAMGKVSGSAHEAVKNDMLKNNDRIVMSRDFLISEAKREVLHMAGSGHKLVADQSVKVLGSTGKAAIMQVIDFMVSGRFISKHDALIAAKIADILTGGDVPCGVVVTEKTLLELEKEAFLSLCGEEKTQQRIEYMLKKGKPLRN